jgi:hypothetical protein
MRLKAMIVAGTLLSALVMTAHATVLPYKSFEQLVSESEGIVMGTVSSVSVAPAGRFGSLHTFVTIDQVEALSGQVPEGRLTLRLKGGFDGRRGLHIDGAPTFRQGEWVLLFVQGNGRDLVPFVGWGQGVFRLRSDGTGRTMVHDADGNEVVGIRAGHVVKRAGPKLDNAVPGAPEGRVQLHHGSLPRSGFSLADGTPAAEVTGDPAATEQAVTAADFVEAVRKKARAGVVLRSVTQGEMTPADAANDRDQVAPGRAPSPSAAARSGIGGITVPQRSLDTPPSDAR